MKRLLSLVLVLAVVLSSMSFAFAAAPSDLGDYKYADEVKKLVGLGIINGYPDGTFRPEGNITRAEFAKVVVTALGYADAAVAAGEAKFSDVNGHWAMGFINVASSLGIINGVGDGKFNPDANVKYEEAVTMIVRALGYEPAAKSNGGYPNGYLTIASQKKITKDVAMVAGNIADRGTVAKLLAESLEVPFLEQTGFGTLTEFKEAKHLDPLTGDYVTDKSLMLTGLKLKLAEGIVVDSYDTDAKTVKFTTDVDKKKTYSYVEPINVVGTKNCKVKFWYKDGVIYAFENKTTVKFDAVKKVNDSDAAGAITAFDSLTFKNDGGLYHTSSSTLNVSFNGGADTAVTNKNQLLDEYVKAYIFENKIYKLEQFTLGNPGIVEKVAADKIKYQTYDTNDAYLSNIDGAEDLLYVFIDGEEKTVEDIKPGMLIKFWNSGKKMVIAASSETVEGKLDSYQDEKVTIGSKTYETVNKNYTNVAKYVSTNDGAKYDQYNVKDLVGVDVVAHLDLIGKVAFVKGKATNTTTDFWGLVKSWKQEGKTITVVRDVNGVSTEVEYAVKTDSDELKGSSLTTTIGTNTYRTWAGFQKLADDTTNRTVGDQTMDASATDANNRIFKFYINSSNQIIKIQTVAQAANSALSNIALNGGNAKFDKDTGALAGSGLYGDGAVYFDLTNNKVRYWVDLKDKSSAPANGLFVGAVDKTLTQKVVVAAFLYDGSAENAYAKIVSSDKFYAFVTGESFDGTWYTITTSDGTTLKLHEDDLKTGAAQADNKFIAYLQESDRIKILAVNKAVYAAGTEFATGGTEEDYDAGSELTSTATTFTKVDGEYVVFAGGTYKKANDMKVIKITWKSNNDIDTATVSDVTSITAGDKVLVVRDASGSIRAIYYVH